MLEGILDRHVKALGTIRSMQPRIEEMARGISACLLNGGKVLLCGNGGSAADCQHIAAELVGRYRRERLGYPAIALTVDTSILTAVGNDYDFNHVFCRQVQALMQPEDILWCISTSGRSANVVSAARWAREEVQGTVYSFTGSKPSPLGAYSHITVAVGGEETARIQECHMIVAHAICEMLDEILIGEDK
jgi:D-sedoheptulose 7-phosphate isomerase